MTNDGRHLTNSGRSITVLLMTRDAYHGYGLKLYGDDINGQGDRNPPPSTQEGHSTVPTVAAALD